MSKALDAEQIAYVRKHAMEFVRTHVKPLLGESLESNTIPDDRWMAITDACALLVEAVLAEYLPASEINDYVVFGDAYDALKPVIRQWRTKEVFPDERA